MTVAQLIAQLQKFDPNAVIEFPIQTYTQRYPSVYVQPNSPTTEDHGKKVRIYLHLGKGYSISERKNKS